MTLLQRTKKELRAYSHVNKKALDQYVHFKEQRESLEERKVELDESEKAIQELIAALDEKKGQAIERTFKMVAKFFSEVFSELTGDGTNHIWNFSNIYSMFRHSPVGDAKAGSERI